jgi:alginate O-acetyltransferase complex protein AlgI
MIFNTYWFILFSAAFFTLYWLLPRPGWRAAWLLAGCGLFHGHFAGPAGVVPIVLLGVFTYLAALTRQRALVHGAIVLNVAALCFYKYALFLSAQLLGAVHPELGAAATRQLTAVLPVAPPLAISFFAFEFVHYLIEVGRGREPIRRPHEFALFAIYFPSLVAGPIKRYQDFTANLHAGLAGVSPADVTAGGLRVMLGVAKKIVLADNLTLMIGFYQQPEVLTTLGPGETWLLLGGIAARILLDFSGYTDMAIGLSRMMGVRLPENFNYPYLATSLQDFWQRWHISLSTWIRDYVYIPLGGNRHGRFRQLANGMIAFALCGLWHGPAWHFVLWGLWHGTGLAVNSSYVSVLGPVGRGLGWFFHRVPLAGWALTLLYVVFGWLLFFHDPAHAWVIASKALGLD